MAKFHAPEIQDNPSGWGPCAVPEKFKDMPYQPFSKGDRLGKVADWTGATYQDKRYTNKYSSQFGGGSQYAYFHEEDETSFQLVDTAKTQKTAYQRNRMRFAQRNLRRDKDRRNLTQFNMQTLPKSAKQKERDRMRLQKKFQKQFGVRQKWDQKSQLKPRDSSVEVRMTNQHCTFLIGCRVFVSPQGGERHKFPNPNPFVEEDIDKSEVASVAYRYRRWKLGEDIDLIVRCEHDGVMTGANGEVSFINVKTLNEWDSRHCNGVDWRQKLDSQRGAVLATELKNNSYKLARWTCCAMLAGSEYLKLGYVSRYHAKDSARHVVLGTQQFQPTEFASQINLSMENAWGILRCVIDICRKLEEGKYLILKDPNKVSPGLRTIETL
uniref:Eukaryotic translation initiation factor 3 subunit D n=1 Tax=Oncorhynchus mykiss TaxID=8022 RepID=A0A8C7PFD4_ONCMY